MLWLRRSAARGECDDEVYRSDDVELPQRELDAELNFSINKDDNPTRPAIGQLLR
jgi:hypothetical protein